MHPLLKTVSEDPTYGYTMENPIKVGPPQRGPSASRHYLMSLRDAHGRPFEIFRNGSVGNGPDGHVIDNYFLTSCTGDRISLFIDMYHPERDPDFQDAPVGLTKGSPNFYLIEMKQLAENPPPAKCWWKFWK